MEKTEELMTYEAPQIEVIEVEVEKGFATSMDLEPDDWFIASLLLS